MHKKKILVSILNFHQAGYVSGLINSLNNQEIDCEIYICIGDIQPTEKEQEVLKEDLNKYKNSNIEYFIIDENPGYAKGNNYIIRRGYERVKPDFILISNPDIVFDDPNVLSKLVNTLNLQHHAAVVGPKVMLSKEKQQGPFKRHNPWEYSFNHLLPFIWLPSYILREKYIKKIKKTKEVFRVIGAFMMIKAEPFYKVGFFDERTFLFWEEDILSEKLLVKKYKTYFEPCVEVQHLHNYIDKKRNKFIEDAFTDSMIKYFKMRNFSEFSISFVRFSMEFYNNFWFLFFIKVKEILKSHKKNQGGF